jgi:signal transduction histidine kinase
MEPTPRLAPLRRLFALASSALIPLFSATAISGAETPGQPLRVVILSGAEVMLPAGQVVDGVIREALSDAGLGPIEFYTEGLDAYRFRSEEYESELAPFLRRKYAERQPALVFALTDMALDFLIRYRSELWPDSAVVFTMVDPKFFESRSRPAWVTGFVDEDDFTETVGLARKLQPDARRILIVGGAGERDVATLSRVSRSLEPLRPGLEIAVKSGVPLADFPREFGRLSADTILLYTMMFRDSQGRSVVPREAARALAAAASVPVYSAHSTHLGSGILGGALFDFEQAGRAAADMGIRILKGEKPSSIAIENGSPRLRVIDDRVLRRFHIPERRLPEGYELRFRQPSFWEQYRWRVVAVGATLAIETALLVALFFERQSRKRAENESRQRRQELAHAARLATVGELAASISHEINQPLGAILANAETAELLLDSKTGNADELRQILTDIRRDDVRASEVMRRVRALAGRREIEMKPLDVNAVAEAAASLLEPEARRRGVGLIRDFRQGLPESRADEVSLQQVIINLALNGMEAMSTTTAGRRRLTIATRSRGSRVVVRVSDSGRGIAPTDRPRLFESFFSTKEHGLGLGLSICRSIIETHGGRISADNDITGGATFEFELPALLPNASAVLLGQASA